MRALLFSLALLGACSAQTESPAEPQQPASAPAQAARLRGIEWRLIGAAGESPPTLTIGEDGRAGGRGGCNRWFSNVDAANGLRFGPIGATKMACLGEDMSTERDFFAMLGRVRAGAVENGELVLRDEGGDAIARFAPSADAGR